ncbi:MAG: hypothetical protein AAF805_00800 [Planctomycetota bacterium]
MGEIAELITGGVLCEQCGRVVDGEARGHVRVCRECRDAEQREIRDAGAARARRWREQFDQAEALAAGAGLRLRRSTDEHYQLTPLGGGWLLNLYPRSGKRKPRVYRDTNLARAPYLAMRERWDLIDAIRAAVRTTRRRPQ